MKRFFASLLVLSMILALAACGGGSGTGDTKPSDTGGTSQPSDTGTPKDTTVYKFTFSNHDAATNPTALFIDEWVAEVEKATEGRIDIEVYNGGSLANVTEGMDMVANGTIDMCWSAPAVFPGRFNTSLASQLPLLNFPTGEVGGKILWDMYSNHTYFSDEWKDFKVIAIHPNSQSVIMTTKKPISSIEDFKGLRLRTTTPAVVKWLESVGGVPMSFQITETFENLEKNVADGTIGDWTNAATQQLYDVLDYAMDYNAFVAVGCVVMNKDSYNKLPDDLKAIFDQYTGEYASAMGGRVLGSYTTEAIETGTKGGMELVAPSDELVAAMQQAADKTVVEWAASMDEKGFDGQQIVDDLKATIEKYSK